MKRVLILGSTGSIGEQALDVIARSDELAVASLSASTGWERLLEQANQSGVALVALADPGAARSARGSGWKGEVLAGEEGIRELISRCEPDVVLNAIVGSAGLGPTIVALSAGIEVALANKESLVVGGELVMALSEAAEARIVPVDSEHSALQQLIRAEPPGSVEKLVLTASGGPFRGRTDLRGITREEALAHPTWDMGGKISIDSATLMNKGLELIEAHHLFGLAYDDIDVVVHPQSLIHALIHIVDGSTLAHLGHPDMRVPIAYALCGPDRLELPVGSLDLAAVGALTFEEPDTETFACLRLAREAGEAGGTAPCVLNAANEVAVESFLAGALPFAGIAEVVEAVLGSMPGTVPAHFEDLFACDEEARARAGEEVSAAATGAASGNGRGAR
ncbi:MAG: 1-deoxy-D-xylulose-5-phosphate reductoisomerase [Solirubrobacterales bacterium]